MPYKVSHGKAIQVSYSPDEVFSRIQHEGIQFINLQFTGLTGHFHHTTISGYFTPEQMRDGLPKLDGSSTFGFTSINDSDLLLKPDPNTFAIIPWMTENKTARLLVMFIGEKTEEDSQEILEEFLKSKSISKLNMITHGVLKLNSLCLIKFTGMY